MTVARPQCRAPRLGEQRIDERKGRLAGRGWVEYAGVRQYPKHTAEHEFRQADALPAGQGRDEPCPATVVMGRIVAECAHQDVDVRALHP